MYIIDLHVHLLLMQICGSTSTSHFCSLFEIYCVTDIYFLWDVKWVQLLWLQIKISVNSDCAGDKMVKKFCFNS